jgi:hypothetical protein
MMAPILPNSRPFSPFFELALLISAMWMTGCSKAAVISPSVAAEDARAIAAVEAAQLRLPPVDFVTLQPISESDGQPCAFNFSASARPPVFRFGPDAGRVVIDGNVKSFAADHGSVEIYPGVRQEFDGTEFSLQLQHDVDDAANRGNAHRWPAKLTMRDRYERPVLLGMGVVTCGPQVASPAATGANRSR